MNFPFTISNQRYYSLAILNFFIFFLFIFLSFFLNFQPSIFPLSIFFFINLFSFPLRSPLTSSPYISLSESARSTSLHPSDFFLPVCLSLPLAQLVTTRPEASRTRCKLGERFNQPNSKDKCLIGQVVAASKGDDVYSESGIRIHLRLLLAPFHSSNNREHNR